MILHPGVLALFCGSLLSLGLAAVAAVVAWQVVRRWDYTSSSAQQLTLERRTALTSTVLNYALAFQVAAAFLFVYTVDDLHHVIIGAMCATGSLNANPVGWYALGLKCALVFACSLWITSNRLDQRCPDYPLTRPKNWALLGLVPLLALDAGLQASYFLGIEPDVIASCCGSLFTLGSETVAGALSGLPPAPTMAVFYGWLALHGVLGAHCLYADRPGARIAYSVSSVGVLAISLAAILSFISLYIYELPTHSCPFDFLQQNYYFVGYPIYVLLGGSAYFGALPGLFEPLARGGGALGEQIRVARRRWLVLSLGFLALFVLLVTYPVVFGDLTLIGYGY